MINLINNNFINQKYNFILDVREKHVKYFYTKSAFKVVIICIHLYSNMIQNVVHKYFKYSKIFFFYNILFYNTNRFVSFIEFF